MGYKVRDKRKTWGEKENTCQIGCRIEIDVADELEKICERECITRSAILRRIIRHYVEENKN